MGSSPPKPLHEAKLLADELVELLRPGCERIEVLGSIRRERPNVHDVELIALPLYQQIEAVTTDLFGDQTSMLTVSALDLLTYQLREQGVLENRLDANGRPAWGSSYKRALYKDFGLDLFIATSREKWACLKVIRTGPADFTRRMVTLRSMPGGFCPKHLRFADGLLVDRHTGVPVEGIEEEDDVFRALGVVTLPPELRTDNVIPPRREGSLA